MRWDQHLPHEVFLHSAFPANPPTCQPSAMGSVMFFLKLLRSVALVSRMLVSTGALFFQ